MAVINLTPDSFYRESRAKSELHIGKMAEEHLKNGADILDFGAYSSRPGAEDVSPEVEQQRLLPAIEFVRSRFPKAIISADTFRSETAAAAIDNGAHIINDISGGQLDPDMFKIIGKLQVPYILMHMRGHPGNMQQLTTYRNSVTQEVFVFFKNQIDKLRESGVKDIILDPGFGFAKKVSQNFELLKNMKFFKNLGVPILAGLSRKSMIYRSLEVSPQEALNGTTVLNTIALMSGVNIIRVHDTKPANELIKLFKLTFNP